MERERKKSRNRLGSEKSPYLLQHARNPVDWYPWGKELFDKASAEDKPVFLSIGYSTCHWCHVMEKESFENEKVAELLNADFVPVKVDREERPDIDAVYMDVCRMMTGRGGWPLTVILTPGGEPFFAATYIPRESRMGMVGMLDLLPKVAELWKSQRQKLNDISRQAVGALGEINEKISGEVSYEEVTANAYTQLSQMYDQKNGGFGAAPKFPAPHNLYFLLRQYKRNKDPITVKMVEKTLKNMRKGGMYDHLGFGFHRYSTEAGWLLPHFEKMLYDQALLAIAYLEAYQATGDEFYAGVAKEVFEYVLRDMTDPGGGFHSAEDADSEGGEGKFYVWSEREIREVLGEEEARFAISVFNVKQDGNFRDAATGESSGENVLHFTESGRDIAARMNESAEAIEKRIEDVRQKLFDVREKRPRPHKDDKILADWNGLMIAAMAMGARVLDDKKLADAAGKAADFVLENLKGEDGELFHRYRDGEAAIKGFLDDYAAMAWGLLELYETTFEVRHLKDALELTRRTISAFRDEENGGFYISPVDSEVVIVRKKEAFDGAAPSGNSIAMMNLVKLARITADTEMEKRALEIPDAFAKYLQNSPSGFCYMLSAMDYIRGPSSEVVIVGTPGAEDTKVLLEKLWSEFIPNKVVVFRPADEENPEIADISGYAARNTAVDGKATAYVCRNFSCELPVTEPDEMLKLLEAQ